MNCKVIEIIRYANTVDYEMIDCGEAILWDISNRIEIEFRCRLKNNCRSDNK
jgi:hypothetical protein